MDETQNPQDPEQMSEQTPAVGETPETETPVSAPAAHEVFASPMPLSMPPFAPPSAESATPQAVSGAEAPGLGGAATPPGDQPPYPPLGASWSPGGPVEQPKRRHTRKALAGVAAGVAILAGGLGAGLGVAFSGGSTAPSSASGSGSGGVALLPKSSSTSLSSTSGTRSVAAIAKSVDPSVVDINVSIASPAGQGAELAAGTGMIVTSTGEILTNNHVVENATSIKVVVAGHGTYTARVLGTDPTKDIALIQLVNAPKGLPYVTLGNSSTVQVGASVVAIGNAYGQGGAPSIATGIVSSLGRTITASDAGGTTSSSETLHGLIQTDAQIAAGDSGGPLLNSQGQVIGMDTAAASGDGGTLGFAIPVNTLRTIVQQIEKGQGSSTVILGTSPFLGIYEQASAGAGAGSGFGNFGGSGTSSNSTVAGVQIYDVVQGGPAQKAGIAAGDTITAINGTTTTTFSALQKAISAEKAGAKITVTFVNTSGTSQTVTVTLTGLAK
ncbi:MAG: hypothetical protein JWM85_2912 [Acidimicrobiaceae bacterium]|nr:hypothetical protein [Acidimicrobiaceae bacterium]